MNRPEDWTRLERLQYLLEQWDTIFDVNAGSATGGGDLGIALLPPMANHPSVKELDRCLQLLAIHAPKVFQHLKCFYNAPTRQVKAKIKVRLPSGRMDTIDGFRIEPIKPGWVDRGKVRSGEQFLAAKFRGPVDIPKPLWDALTKELTAA